MVVILPMRAGVEFSTWDIVLTLRKALDLRDWGDGSVGNVLAVQTREPELI